MDQIRKQEEDYKQIAADTKNAELLYKQRLRESWRQNMDEVKRKMHEEKERKIQEERNMVDKLNEDIQRD